MKIIGLSDMHGAVHFPSSLVDELQHADFIVLSGDITHFGRKKQIEEIINELQPYNKNILAIPGNCDFHEVNIFLVEKDMSLDSRYRIANNHFFMGLGGSLPCPGKTPNEYTEDEFVTLLEETVKANTEGLPIILIVHQPPFNTKVDQLSDGFHTGSHTIRFFIEKYQPLLCFCGHLHESEGIDQIGQTLIVNPGSFKMGNYVKAEISNGIVKVEIANSFIQ